MKIHFVNDIHLETGDYSSLNDIDCDVVVASGDIGEGIAGVSMLKKVNKPCIYVLGNHELWCSDGSIDFQERTEEIKSLAKGSNVHFLENDEVVIDGVRFLGTTLWTNFGELSPELIRTALRYMRDYTRIGASSWFDDFENVAKFKLQMEELGFEEDVADMYIKEKKFHPLIAFDLHEKAVNYLDKKLSEEFKGETIVVSHHAPTFTALKEFGVDDRFLIPETWDRCRDDQSLVRVGCYASNLDWLLKKHKGKVSLWGFGHLHKFMDFVHEGIRFISNPRGYYEGPLTMKQADVYSVYGFQVKEEDVLRSIERFKKEPFLGSVPEHKFGWVVNSVGAIEERLLRVAVEAIDEASDPIDKLKEIVPFLDNKNKVIIDALKESAMNRYNEARSILRAAAIKIIDQLEIKSEWESKTDNDHVLLMEYDLIGLSENVSFVFRDDDAGGIFELKSPTEVVNEMLKSLSEDSSTLLGLPFHHIRVRKEVLDKLRSVSLKKGVEIYISGWITLSWVGSVKDFVNGRVFIDGMSFEETDKILTGLQKGVHLMVGSLDKGGDWQKLV